MAGREPLKALAALPAGRWEELHRLMVAQDFPDVPPTFAEAKRHMATARIYGLCEGSELMAAFVFGPPQEGVSFLDVVCAPLAQGRWATPAVLRQLYALAFEKLGLRVVWTQPKRRAGLKAALQAGFVPGTALDGNAPVLLMTPFGVPRKFRSLAAHRKMKVKGDLDDGKFVQ